MCTSSYEKFFTSTICISVCDTMNASMCLCVMVNCQLDPNGELVYFTSGGRNSGAQQTPERCCDIWNCSEF